MQNDTAKNNTKNTKSSNKKSLKINLASLKIDNMTKNIFGMTTSVEKNYHVESDEIERIFDANVFHCKEVKHSTSDDYEQLKY